MLLTEENGKLRKLAENGFPLEKDLQTFVENNIETLLGLQFIATEFVMDEHNRADTIAYDDDSHAFVIIEDKNVANRSLVDQGYAYLAIMLDRKEKFVLKYNEIRNENKTIKDFDWSQSRIVFISPEYTERQITATSFSNMPFELYELRKFENVYSWKNVTRKMRNNSNKFVPTKTECNSSEPLSEIKVFSEEDLITTSHPLYTTYESLRERIMNLPDVEMFVLKSGIKFKVDGKRIGEVDRSGITQDKFDFLISNGSMIKDPHGLMIDISSRGWGKLSHRVVINESTDLDAVMYIIEQCYNNIKKEI